MRKPITVLVVDDSAMIRKLVANMLSMTPEISVVGQACDGIEALRMISELDPDVVTLDVEMPRMNGLETLKAIMRHHPLPVVMLAGVTHSGTAATVQCLEAGAVEFVAKPSGQLSQGIGAMATELVAKVRLAAVAHLHPDFDLPPVKPKAPARVRKSGGAPTDLIVIGSSTGGPSALHDILSALSVRLDAAVVIVQHMPAMFTTSLADRLDQISALSVREARDGDTLEPGRVLVAPGGYHLEFNGEGRACLSEGPPVHGVRPSIDVTLASLTATRGRAMMAVLLTGMGRDGARGLLAVQAAGGRTIAQDEASCVVYGMPRVAAVLGAVDEVVPLRNIARTINEAVGERLPERIK